MRRRGPRIRSSSYDKVSDPRAYYPVVLSRRLVPSILAAVLCAACAERISVVDPNRDGGRSSNGGNDAATPDANTPNPGSDTGATGDPDGGMTGHDDATVNPSASCMRTVADNIHVPEPASPKPFSGVRSLVFDSAGDLYVLNREGPPYTGWVHVLARSPNHAHRRTVGAGIINDPRDLAVDSTGNMHVVTYDPEPFDAVPEVHVFNPMGAEVSVWNADAGGTNAQDEAWSAVIDSAGRLNIGGLVVYRYSLAGAFIDQMGLWGGIDGRIGRAEGLAWDPMGIVLVADLARNMVHRLDSASRNQLSEFGGRGSAPGEFDGAAEPDVRWGPTRLAVDARRNIYANDPFNSRIQKFSPQGQFLGEFVFGGSRAIHSIAVDPLSGNIYVGRDFGIDIICPL